ncbi:MAG: DinB family protein, partial [Bacteroidota bacterium]
MLIQQAARGLLHQLTSVLTQLTDEDFSKPIGVLSGSSVGQHVRHTIEFFICLMDGVGKGEINYDNRKHDQFIQEDRKLAL